MKTTNNNTSLQPLSHHEITQINGGCEGPFCVGYLFEAADIAKSFWSGVVRGFNDGFAAAQRTN